MIAFINENGELIIKAKTKSDKYDLEKWCDENLDEQTSKINLTLITEEV